MKKLIIALTAVTMFFYSCEKEADETRLPLKQLTLTSEAPQAINSSNEFGIELFNKAALTEEGNIMLSPLSASTALSMLLNGCSGETYSQLQAALKYPADLTLAGINKAYQSLVDQLLTADPKVKLSLANAIFYRTGFSVKPDFLSVMSTDYEADVEGLNFGLPSALTTINKWASDNTAGKIPKVLDEISEQAVMFIMNALYFKGDWSYQFDKAQTQDRPFTSDSGIEHSVSTMRSEVGTRLTSGTGYRAAEMPYGRTNFTMIVIVPDSKLVDFHQNLTNGLWQELTSSLDSQDEFTEKIVQMPKFKFSYEKYLNDQLKSMGMTDAFDPMEADLSGITDESVFVSFVKQNTFVEVDEEGTEAAAVTTIGIELASIPPQAQEFIVDKPFIFVIRERTTNTILFIGRVSNPAS